MTKLTGRQMAELRALVRTPGLWAGVPPNKADDDLWFYITHRLVERTDLGYVITEAGRVALGSHQ